MTYLVTTKNYVDHEKTETWIHYINPCGILSEEESIKIQLKDRIESKYWAYKIKTCKILKKKHAEISKRLLKRNHKKTNNLGYK